MSRELGVFTYSNSDPAHIDSIAWPESMWPLHPSILQGLPDELWPEREALHELQYPWEFLVLMNTILAERVTESRGVDEATFESRGLTVLDGPIWFGDGATIFALSKVYGPAFIGPEAIVGSLSLVRDGVTLGQVGAHCEIKSSYMGRAATTSHHNIILDTVLSRGVRCAGEAVTANVSTDGRPVSVVVGDERIDTGLTRLGAFLGAGAIFGASARTMPGKLVGAGSRVGGGVILFDNVPDNMSVANPRVKLVQRRLDVTQDG